MQIDNQLFIAMEGENADFNKEVRESITIGDDIKIQVLEIKGKQVRLGIQAPKKYSIHREEIYQRIQEENRLAAQQSPLSLKTLTDIWRKKKS